jgi:hypothetical protein
MNVGIGVKAKRKASTRKYRRIWLDNIKKNPREIGWSYIDWIDLAEFRDKWNAVDNTVILEYLSDWRLHKKGSVPLN